ncbi:MAG TPA: DUF167 domain-containing protein [Candidatus Limnocylindria bacterium]
MTGVGLVPRGERVHFRVRLTPRAQRAGLTGVRDGVLLARVTAAPERGAANAALVRLLADALDVPPSAIAIEAGATARLKRLSAPSGAEARLRAL